MGCITPAPAGHTPGGVLMSRQICLPCADKVSQISCGMDLIKVLPSIHGPAYSTFGMARISQERFGVAPCQARLSRNTPAPAGAPTNVESRIHSGSSIGVGGLVTIAEVPGICRIGPFSQVRSVIKKLIVTCGEVRSMM